MPDQPLRYFEFSCGACGREVVWSSVEVVDQLRKMNVIGRRGKPPWDIFDELLAGAVGRMQCGECSAIGLSFTEATDLWDDDGPQARACEACNQPIDPLRLEALPNARLCSACQRLDESGQSPDPPDYCPRCGSIMHLRQTRAAGLTRYAMHCPACSGRGRPSF